MYLSKVWDPGYWQVNGILYNPPTEYHFLDQRRKLKLVNRIKRNIAKFKLNPEDGEFGKALNIGNQYLKLVGSFKDHVLNSNQTR